MKKVHVPVLLSLLLWSSVGFAQARFPYVISSKGEQFFLDGQGPPHLWARASQAAPFVDFGPPSGINGRGAYAITGGLSVLYSETKQYTAVFGIDSAGNLWEFGHNWVLNSWQWYPHPVSPGGPCGQGVLTGNPVAVNEIGGVYFQVLARCTNGDIVERYLGMITDTQRYYTMTWINHGHPNGTSPTDPAAISDGRLTRLLFVDAAQGKVWAAFGSVNGNDWTFRNASNPGVAVVGNASLVRNPASYYIGGFFVTADRNAWELRWDGLNWDWEPHPLPVNCPALSLKHSFTLGAEKHCPGVIAVAVCDGAGTRLARFDNFNGGSWDLQSELGTLAGDPAAMIGEGFYKVAHMVTDGNLRHAMTWSGDNVTAAPAWVLSTEFINGNLGTTIPTGCGVMTPPQQLYYTFGPRWWFSCDGRFSLELQGDGNLVLYQAMTTVLWATNTKGQGGNTAVMQPDGNFVLYTGANVPVWATNTANHPGAILSIQDDGNLVVHTGNTVHWASNTCCH